MIAHLSIFEKIDSNIMAEPHGHPLEGTTKRMNMDGQKRNIHTFPVLFDW
jgi:hypothetical protein